MREGLAVIQIPGRYWSVTRIGWLRRVSGDEWEIHGARTIIRTGEPRTLDDLAATGAAGHRLTPAAILPEQLHRLLVRRCVMASVDAWAMDCPEPEVRR